MLPFDEEWLGEWEYPFVRPTSPPLWAFVISLGGLLEGDENKEDEAASEEIAVLLFKPNPLSFCRLGVAPGAHSSTVVGVTRRVEAGLLVSMSEEIPRWLSVGESTVCLVVIPFPVRPEVLIFSVESETGLATVTAHDVCCCCGVDDDTAVAERGGLASADSASARRALNSASLWEVYSDKPIRPEAARVVPGREGDAREPDIDFPVTSFSPVSVKT